MYTGWSENRATTSARGACRGGGLGFPNMLLLKKYLIYLYNVWIFYQSIILYIKAIVHSFQPCTHSVATM